MLRISSEFIFHCIYLPIIGPLDFDLGPKSYSISILAEDKDFSGITNLNIQLTDENDIAPMITNSDFSITIPESAPGGTEVFDVNIQDIDTVGTITYSISSGNTNNSFIIDSSGIVTISATALDFEAISSFSLVIEVSDGPHQVSNAFYSFIPWFLSLLFINSHLIYLLTWHCAISCSMCYLHTACTS
ncbi:Protocadherin Fat 1-like isoform X2 [Oopsacas minuta]|uniref:Protocadherin Fat 1-like isoform X2 n=1 Tax=Oopsacas minuta TaxID=111878 RepID=A0AAV7K7K2_9METZ|nr:Protocadherin Fat 1-like isoform X2 [Oopsacas minuta]